MVYSELDGPQGADGWTFVLVHGIGMGRAVFADLAVALAAHGRVFGIDLPGFGDSPQPEQRLTMPQAGDLLAEWMKDVLPGARETNGRGAHGNGRIAVVGHSMGTEVVAEAVVRHPGIADVAILIAPTINSAERSVRMQLIRMVQDLSDESPKVLVKGLIQYLKASPLWMVRVLRDMLEHRIEETVEKIDVPTLVMRGSEDAVCPREWVQEIARRTAGAEYGEAIGRGHEAMIRCAHPVAEMILSFLGRVPLSTSPSA